MSALRVSLVQEPLAWHDPPANRERFSALLTPLAQRTDLIVLPETFTSGFSMEVERLAERAGGPTVTWMQAQAARTEAAITGSVIPWANPPNVTIPTGSGSIRYTTRASRGKNAHSRRMTRNRECTLS